MRHSLVRAAGAIAGAALFAAGCSIAPITDGEFTAPVSSEFPSAPERAEQAQPSNPTGPNPANLAPDTEGLEWSGPTTNSHWHAAYVVRICNEVLEPFAETNDPLGIHSHGDGLVHVHPFTPDAAWEQATLGVFADAVGFTLDDDELIIPGVGSWTEEDSCDGEPARLRVHRWSGPEATVPWETVDVDLAAQRFLSDGELFTISFAPESAPPVKPPAASRLAQVSPAILQPLPPTTLTVPDSADASTTRLFVVDAIEPADPSGGCPEGWVPERLRRSTDPSRCFAEGELQFGADTLGSAEARFVNRSPGLIIDLGRENALALNELITEREERAQDGGVLVAIDAGGEVVVAVRFLRPLAETRFGFTGAMTGDVARELASVLSANG